MSNQDFLLKPASLVELDEKLKTPEFLKAISRNAVKLSRLFSNVSQIALSFRDYSTNRSQNRPKSVISSNSQKLKVPWRISTKRLLFFLKNSSAILGFLSDFPLPIFPSRIFPSS